MNNVYKRFIQADTTAPVQEPSMEEQEIGELEIAEYLVFLLALDTYLRWLEEIGNGLAMDDHSRKGVGLLRRMDFKYLEDIGKFLQENLKTNGQKNMLEKALRQRPTARGASQRSFLIRSAISKGGASTMRAIFQTNKALAAVRAAIAASMVDDADAALDKFAAVPLRNTILEGWIDQSAKLAGGGQPPGFVTAASVSSASATKTLTEVNIQQAGASVTSDAVKEAETTKTQILETTEVEATKAAKKSLDAKGIPDLPPARSEVAGIATAAAIAVASNPENPVNIPESLKHLSEENRAVALMSGRVRVAASAGAGKTTSLVARVMYLLNEQQVPPEKIFITTFSVKAAEELKGRLSKKVSLDILKRLTIGTTHSTMRELVTEYGSDSQKELFKGRALKEGQILKAILSAWEECFPPPKDEKELQELQDQGKTWSLPPKLKRMRSYMNTFQSSGMGMKEVVEWMKANGGDVLPEEFKQAGVFFDFYQGFKGARGPNWIPKGCPQVKNTFGYKTYSSKNRPNGERLYDFNDMLNEYRKMLETNPLAKKAIQERFSHIFIDECQDNNPLQSRAFMLMSEHIEKDSKDKSIWMVGDANQAIFAFRGADPSGFEALEEQHNFKTGFMATNRRCAPEILEASNKLIEHNEQKIPLRAKPLPEKIRGQASLKVEQPLLPQIGALNTARRIKSAHAEGKPLSDFAVLCRTNKEIIPFVNAMAASNIPFVVKKGDFFLEDTTSKTFISYLNMVTSADSEVVAESLPQILRTTGVLSLGKKTDPDILSAIKRVVTQYCLRSREDSKSFDLLGHLVEDSSFREDFIRALDPMISPYALRHRSSEFYDIIERIVDIKTLTVEDKLTTEDLFTEILSIPCKQKIPHTSPDGKGITWEVVDVPLSAMMAKQKDQAKLESDTADEENEDEPNVLGIFYEMAKADPSEPDMDPSKPLQFKEKLDNFKKRAEELRIDPVKWANEHPGETAPPPGVYLGTAHSSKGLEWSDVTVSMPAKRFPLIKRAGGKASDDPMTVPEEDLTSTEEDMENERRLAYVAMTRAVSNLTIQCPLKEQPFQTKSDPISEFVMEAGLKVGENVPRPILSEVPVTPSNPEEEEVAFEDLTFEDEPPLKIASFNDRLTRTPSNPF